MSAETICVVGCSGFVGSHVTAELLATSVRTSLALEDLVVGGDLAAITMNFLKVAAAGAETMPFLGASRLMANGIGYAGDPWKTNPWRFIANVKFY